VASRRRRSVSAPDSSGSPSRSRTRERRGRRTGSTQFVVADDKERVLPVVAALRRAGLAVDLDYAGRSRNAQIKHAQRLDATAIIVVEGGEATIRERGIDDERVPLDALVARLARP